MTPACPFSKRVVPGLEWDTHKRIRCPHCDRRVIVVAGRVREHRLPARGRVVMVGGVEHWCPPPRVHAVPPLPPVWSGE